MILKLGMQHWGPKVYKVCIKDDPVLTLNYFSASSNKVTYAFAWDKLLHCHLEGKIPASDQINRRLMFLKKDFIQGGCLRLPLGCVHVRPLFSNIFFSETACQSK